MKTKQWKKIGIIISFLALAAIALSGCSGGSDGAAGAKGDAGVPGDPGVPGPVTLTQESCNVCHGTDATWDIAADAQHPVALEKPVVSNIVVSRSAGDVLTVTFTVQDTNGDPISGIGITAPSTGSDVRVYMASIVPAGTVTANAPKTTWDTDFLEMWAEERGDDAGVVLTEPTAGNYSFVMTAAALAGIGGADALEATLAQTQRVYIRADARDFTGFNRTVGVADFTMPAAGANTGVITATTRTIVAASACTACHSDPLQGAAHGGGYQSPQVCIMCHSPIGVDGDDMQASGFWLASLIHNIHAANTMTGAWPGETPADFSEITYPKNIKDCAACHFDAGQDMADAWRSNPTAEACGTCHAVTFTGAAATHSGGAQLNADCAVCHPASGNGFGQSVTTAHTVTTNKALDASGNAVSITPVYTSTIALSADANADGVYEAGEAPLVTVTVAGAAGAYNDAAAWTAASLYVYGPRSKAVPVLTTNSTTDPAYIAAHEADSTALPTQSHSMLITSTDAQVRTDANGFKYQLLAIPDDLEPGTYMVQVAIGHSSSRVTGSRNYKIDGWAIKTFQVGTATAQLKVSGGGNIIGTNAGGCDNCHTRADWGTMYHRSYFGTDVCLACHDQSGNHADPLANRVHAVHAASVAGDYLALDWSEITYPQDVTTCVSCHDSGNTSYKTEPAAWGFACLGCHGDTAGAKDHMMQNGAPFAAH